MLLMWLLVTPDFTIKGFPCVRVFQSSLSVVNQKVIHTSQWLVNVDLSVSVCGPHICSVSWTVCSCLTSVGDFFLSSSQDIWNKENEYHLRAVCIFAVLALLILLLPADFQTPFLSCSHSTYCLVWLTVAVDFEVCSSASGPDTGKMR